MTLRNRIVLVLALLLAPLAARAGEPYPPAAGGATETVVAVRLGAPAAALPSPPLAELPRFHVQGRFDPFVPPSGGIGQPPPAGPLLVEPGLPPVDAASVEAGTPGALARQFEGITFSGWVPPDTQIAVGPSQVLEAVNSGFAIYKKSGVREQSYTSFTTLLAPLLPAGWSGFLFDPRVVYSPDHGRYLMLVLGRDDFNQQSSFFLLISTSDDLDDGWWGYRIGVTEGNADDADAWADYCGLGADAWGAYVTCNLFHWEEGFKYARLWSFPTVVFTGAPTTPWSFWDLRWNNGWSADSLQPALPYGVAADEATFFVNGSVFSGNSLVLWRLTGDRGDTPTLERATIAVQSYFAIGENVAQPDTTIDLDGGDARIQNAAYKDRKVYAVLTTDPDVSRQRSGWLTFKLDVDTNALDWQHLTVGDLGTYYVYPALTLDGYGGADPKLALFGSWTRVGDSPQYASALYKMYTDPPDTSTGLLSSYAAGESSYVRIPGTRNRWGDYSGAAFDWTTGLVWGAAEAAGTANRWSTEIAGVEVGDFACLADAYEPNDIDPFYTPLASGVPQQHSLCNGDVDLFEFTLDTLSAVRVELSGNGIGDPFFRIFYSPGVEGDDNGGAGAYPLFERTCEDEPLWEGQHVFVIHNFFPTAIPEYEVHFEVTDTCACPEEFDYRSHVFRGEQTLRASRQVSVGPDVQLYGEPLRIYADRVVIHSGAEIGGSLKIGNPSPSCAEAL